MIRFAFGGSRGNRTVALAAVWFASVLLFSFGATSASAQCSLATANTWTGGNGNWSNNANWSSGTAPGFGSGGTNVCITQSTATTVTLDINPSVASLQLGSTDSLDITAGTSLAVNGPDIINAGNINFSGASGNEANLNFNASTTLTGGGTLTLAYTTSPSPGPWVFISDSGGSNDTLTNVNNTIQGIGEIQVSHLGLINEAGGTIDANVSQGTEALTLAGFGGAAGVTNAGLMEATNGGTLVISNVSPDVINLGGNITANGGTVQLSGETIQGGTLNQMNGGVLEVLPGGTGFYLDGSNATNGAVTLNGTFTDTAGATTNLLGTINNNGTIQLMSATGNDATLGIAGNTTLQGGGTVTLSGPQAVITPTGTADSFTFTNVNNTIQGAGTISVAHLVAFDNESGGTVNANVSGQTLLVEGFGGNGSLTNGGLMEATNGATLTIENLAAPINNAGGTIEAGASSTVALNGVNTTISGGNMDGVGTFAGNITLTNGTITPGFAATTAPGTLAVTGTYTQSGGAFNELLGGTSNFGVLNVSGTVNLSAGTTALDVSLINGFTPTSVGETFTILDAAGGLTGEFSQGTGDFVADGYNWTVTYTADDAILTAGTAIGPATVTATWSTASGNWTTAAQWSCSPGPATCVPNNGTPASTNYAAVLNSAGNTITLDSTSSPKAVTINSLNVEAGEVDVNTGASLTVTGSTTVGNSVDDVVRSGGGTFNLGTLTNLSGGTLTGGGYQAAGGILNINGNVTTISGSTTAIILDGAGSEVANGAGNALAGLTNNNGGFFDVYDGASQTIVPGTGTFSNDGGTVAAAFGGSSISVTGGFSNTAGGALVVNGNFGGATINVAGNFTNDSASGTTTVTVENGGALNITGAGNSFTNQNDAQLLVNTGGTAGVAGNFTNESLASVQVNDGSLTIGGNLTNKGVAGIVVSNGGSLSVKGAAGVTNSSNITIGSASDTANSGLTVTNAFTNSGSLTLIANAGTTTTLATVGSFANTGDVSIQTASTLTSNGAYTQSNGGSTNVQGTLNGTGGVTINGGTATVSTGGTVSTTSFTQTGGSVQGTGSIGAAGGLYSMSGGTITPGSASTPGTLTIIGNYTQDSAGTLSIDLSGTGPVVPGDVSLLDVIGTADLGGTVDFTALAGFDPTVGDDYTFLDFGSETGDFSSVVFTGWTCPTEDTCTEVLGTDSVSLDIAAATAPPPPPPPPTNSPEPGAFALLAIGLLAVGVFYRRKTIQPEL